jgi:hypothetical protein
MGTFVVNFVNFRRLEDRGKSVHIDPLPALDVCNGWLRFIDPLRFHLGKQFGAKKSLAPSCGQF